MKISVFMFIFIFTGTCLYAQMQRGDSILANENAIQRPLTLHKNQIRIGLGYDFFIYNSRFDIDGNREKLSDLGIVASKSEIPVLVQYGILDYFEASVGLQYNNQTYRDLQIGLISSYDIPVFVNDYHYKRGLSDIDLNLSGRVPLRTNKIDILFIAGISLPVSDNKPAQPEHSIQTKIFTDSTYEITYNYYEAWGNGTIIYYAGFGFRYRFSKGAVNLFGRYSLPSGISESVTWSHRLVDMSLFDYMSDTYQYQIDNGMNIRFRGEYLLFPWFDITLDIEYFNASGGWSGISGKRVANYDRNQLILVPGYEILATSRFWIRQRMTLPLSGANMLATTSIETRLIYNLFVK